MILCSLVYQAVFYEGLIIHKSLCSFVSGVALSSDFIAGFCGESEDDHSDTLSLMSSVGYDMAFMFAYSMRKVRDAFEHLIITCIWDVQLQYA